MSTFIKHASCEECESIDNFAIYQADDGTFNGSCFGCQHYRKNIDEDGNDLTDSSIPPKIRKKHGIQN